MKTSLDCIPCFVNQTLTMARLFCNDEETQLKVMCGVLEDLSRLDTEQSPPAMAQVVHRRIRKQLRDPDPYLALKQESNRVALELLPQLKGKVRNSLDPFASAVRLAIVGNLIDFGVQPDLDTATLVEAIEAAAETPLRGGLCQLKANTQSASRILPIADNAGEVVLDRLLLEQLPAERTALVVRGAPVLNDVTLNDVSDIGLPDGLEVISNGSDAPGTILEDCDPAFVERFRNADLIIAKGQGNYETLSDVEGPVVFLLKVKCPVIARNIGHPVGSHVVEHSRVVALQAS